MHDDRPAVSGILRSASRGRSGPACSAAGHSTPPGASELRACVGSPPAAGGLRRTRADVDRKAGDKRDTEARPRNDQYCPTPAGPDTRLDRLSWVKAVTRKRRVACARAQVYAPGHSYAWRRNRCPLAAIADDFDGCVGMAARARPRTLHAGFSRQCS